KRSALFDVCVPPTAATGGDHEQPYARERNRSDTSNTLHTRLTSLTDDPAAFFPEPSSGARVRRQQVLLSSLRAVTKFSGPRQRVSSMRYPAPPNDCSTLGAVFSPRRDVDLGREEGPRPFVDRCRGDPTHIRLHQIPIDRLSEERDSRVAHQHLLRLLILLVAAVGLQVRSGHAHEVVVLLVLPEAHVVGARGQEDVVPVRWVRIVRGPAKRPRDLKFSCAQTR